MGIRFGVSPLNELVMSLRALRSPAAYPLARRWLRATRAARRQLDSSVISALITDDFLTPDFCNPRPEKALTDLADELAAVEDADLDRVRRDLDLIWPQGWPAVLSADPRRQIVDALRAYWDACLAPHWFGFRALLRADIADRGQTAAEHGIATMLEGLSDQVRLDQTTIVVENPYSTDGWTRATDWAGLVLVPSMVTFGVSHPLGPQAPPMLMYPVRASELITIRDGVGAADHLHSLLGRAKATVLILSGEPQTSRGLAGELGVSASAVNQHLRALHRAGLLDSARDGRHVVYRRSPLGQQLLDSDRG